VPPPVRMISQNSFLHTQTTQLCIPVSHLFKALLVVNLGIKVRFCPTASTVTKTFIKLKSKHKSSFSFHSVTPQIMSSILQRLTNGLEVFPWVPATPSSYYQNTVTGISPAHDRKTGCLLPPTQQ
jgi:hypothetical protein